MDMARSELSWSERVHVAAVIRYLCAEQGITLLELARRAEVNYQRVKAIARGRTEADADTRRRLEAALGARFRRFAVEFDPADAAHSVEFARVRRLSSKPADDSGDGP